MSATVFVFLAIAALALMFLITRRGGPLRRHQEFPQPADITWPDLEELIDVPVPDPNGGTRWIPGRFAGSDEEGRAIVHPIVSGYGTEIRTYEWDWPAGDM